MSVFVAVYGVVVSALGLLTSAVAMFAGDWFVVGGGLLYGLVFGLVGWLSLDMEV